MPIIKAGKLIDDSWQRLADDAPLPATGAVIVSYARFRKEQADFLGLRPGLSLGVVIPPDVQAKDVGDVAEELDLVAIDFPKFADGRGYSTARLLRQRYGFKGELRAVGNVLRDQLFYMQRCGIESFELTPGKDLEGALEAFAEYSVTYQGAVDDPRPLFRRR